ncbi:DUF1127 domain-containing protein [Rhodobacter sp. HX-7-19]|uniref:DUF1127 domain-containing protein n=2 Tax=Paragemmobacter kunshanensis TaxID=2583234 RepID=A0A6M1U7M8_9RHOB|nr:DUF1127 domain-containing protein [Rhodobacter kunshanensis]
MFRPIASPAPSRRLPLLRHLPARLLASLGLRRQRLALARLDDRLLADIGLTPDAARIESERPVWDAPAHWRG